jgi:YidC/Oxa1 family membrane protein insertase
MQRNTLLAIILSVCVLFGYETIFMGPKRAQMLKDAQISKNKEVASNSAPVQTAPSVVTQEVTKSTNPPFSANSWDFKTSSAEHKIANEGGALHNSNILGRIVPLDQILAIKGLEHAEYKLISQSDDQVVIGYSDKDWKITKTFTKMNKYTTKVRMEITKLMSNLNEIDFILLGINTGETLADRQRQMDATLYEYSTYSHGKVVRKGGASKFGAKENKIHSEAIQWAGFREHYTTVVVTPQFETKAFEVKALTDKSLQIIAKMPTISGGVYEFDVYAGPQDASLMKKQGGDIHKIVAFSGIALFNWLAMFMYSYVLPFLYMILKSWGLAIIAIALLIYGVTYPLTIKSMMSMKRMQQMQPKIKAIQERFKNDPQKLNAEIMDIYRREKINPLSGCLPMLLQMPIFFVLYQVLWRSFYFKGEKFLWIKDLTTPDRLFTMPFSLPFLGNEFNILPLVMGVVMFIQQKISSSSTVTTDEQQAMQQKMMLYIMPIFMTFIFYKFASGLCLYFVVFYSLSALTQWKMSKVK